MSSDQLPHNKGYARDYKTVGVVYGLLFGVSGIVSPYGLGTGEGPLMAEEGWKNMIETAGSNFKERRTNGRCSFIASAELVDPSSNWRLATRTSDINRGGCYIDTLNPLPVGTTVSLRVSKENRSFKVNAEVVYIQTGNGMGLAFTAAEAEELRTLEQWIAGLDAAMAPNILPPGLPQSSERVPASHQSQERTGRSAHEQDQASSLMYLILMLVQKNVLSEMEGKALLEKLAI